MSKDIHHPRPVYSPGSEHTVEAQRYISVDSVGSLYQSYLLQGEILKHVYFNWTIATHMPKKSVSV